HTLVVSVPTRRRVAEAACGNCVRLVDSQGHRRAFGRGQGREAAFENLPDSLEVTTLRVADEVLDCELSPKVEGDRGFPASEAEFAHTAGTLVDFLGVAEQRLAVAVIVSASHRCHRHFLFRRIMAMLLPTGVKAGNGPQ